MPATPDEPDRSRDKAEHRHTRGEEFGAKCPEYQERKARSHKDEAAVLRPVRRVDERAAPLPRDQERDRRDKQSVRVVAVIDPVVDKADKDVAVQKEKCAGGGGQDYDGRDRGASRMSTLRSHR